MSALHDKENNITAVFSKHIKENVKTLDYLFKDCSDLVSREFTIGGTNQVQVYIIYIDNMAVQSLIDEDIMRYLLFYMEDLPKDNTFSYIMEKGIRSADMSEVLTLKDGVEGILSGETLLLVNGYEIYGIGFNLYNYHIKKSHNNY